VCKGSTDPRAESWGPGPLGRAPGTGTERLPGTNQALPSATESCRAELEDERGRDQKDFLLRPWGPHRNRLKLILFVGCLKRRQSLSGSQEEQEKALEQACWSYTPEKQLNEGMMSALGSVAPRKSTTARTCVRTNISGQPQIQSWALMQRCTLLLLYHPSFSGETQFLRTY